MEKPESTILGGPVLPVLFRLSVPMYIGNCVQMVFYIANVFWVTLIDRKSAVLLGAMGMMVPVAQCLLAICNGMTVASSSIVSRAAGEGNGNKSKMVVRAGLALTLAVAGVVLAFGYAFGEQLVLLLGARDGYFDQALAYWYYVLPTVLLMCVGSVIAGVLQGHGLMRPVMFALLFGTVANMLLDPLLIYVLQWKLKGAALATTISQLGILTYYCRLAVRNRLLGVEPFKLGRAEIGLMRSLVGIAVPVSFAQLMVAFCSAIYNRIMADIDSLAVASFSLCSRFDQVVLMPVSAISVALCAMVGQNIGRKNYRRVTRIWKVAMATSFAIVLALATAMILMTPRLYAAVQHNTGVWNYAVRQTRVMEYGYLLTATCMLSNGVFQGIGETRPVALITFVQSALVAVPLMLLLRALRPIDMDTVWGCLIAGNLVAACLSVLWIRRRLEYLAREEVTASNRASQSLATAASELETVAVAVGSQARTPNVFRSLLHAPILSLRRAATSLRSSR